MIIPTDFISSAVNYLFYADYSNPPAITEDSLGLSLESSTHYRFLRWNSHNIVTACTHKERYVAMKVKPLDVCVAVYNQMFLHLNSHHCTDYTSHMMWEPDEYISVTHVCHGHISFNGARQEETYYFDPRGFKGVVVWVPRGGMYVPDRHVQTIDYTPPHRYTGLLTFI